MELLVPEITTLSIIIPTILLALVVGSFLGIATDEIVGFLMGAFVGAVLGLMVSLTFADSNRQAEVEQAFESAYNVILQDGTIPIGPYKSEVVKLFTVETDGSAACTVSTTSDKYEVVCDGEELRPVKK